MILTATINEVKRRILFDNPQAVVAVKGDYEVNGIAFAFPAIYEDDFDLSTAVKTVYYKATDGIIYNHVVTDTDTDTGYPLWVFKDEINKGAFGDVEFALVCDKVEGGNIVKRWVSMITAFRVQKSIEIDESAQEDNEQTYSERLAYLMTQMANMQATVSGLASGAPTAVSLASGMTDTNKLYVYTGSESGYTAGHWYYYNGSAWADGGQYGGTSVDTTLTVSGAAADAKVTGDKIAEIKEDLSALEEQGGLSATMKSNLATVLENIVTKEDVSTEISALIEELRAVWTITNNLTNVTTSNSASEVSKDARYTATLTPISGYSISNVTVLMGGANVTDTAYHDGVINIASVTGNLVITAIASESEEESQYTGYLTVGNPQIVDGVLTPAEGAYITSNCEIVTNGKPWELVTRIHNTSSNIYQDIFRSVDANGNGDKTLIVEKAGHGTKPNNFGMLIGDGSNWSIVANTALVQSGFTLNTWHKVAFGWTGSAYYIRRYTDDTTYEESIYSSTTAMPTFGKLAVGMKANALFVGQIDLKATKLYIDGALYWKAM